MMMMMMRVLDETVSMASLYMIDIVLIIQDRDDFVVS